MRADDRRNKEWSQLVKTLGTKLVTDSEGNVLQEKAIIKKTFHLMNAIDQRFQNSSNRCLIGDDAVRDAIQEIAKFSKTPEEARVLLKHLLLRLINEGFYTDQSRYAHQVFQRGSALYGGGNPSDEVPDLEGAD